MLTQKFHEYKMATGDTVVQHIAKVQNMGAQLIDLGETVTEVTIMAKNTSKLIIKIEQATNGLGQCGFGSTDAT